MKKLCFLDMDGVLADFVAGAFAHAHMPYDLSSVPRGNWFGMGVILKGGRYSTETEFWESLTPEFWLDLKPHDECFDILDAARDVYGEENVAISTATKHGTAVEGKRMWIEKHAPWLVESMLFGGKKHLIAGPGKVLVDDQDRKVKAFREFGGQGIVLPRHWNSGVDNHMFNIREDLEKAHGN